MAATAARPSQRGHGLDGRRRRRVSDPAVGRRAYTYLWIKALVVMASLDHPVTVKVASGVLPTFVAWWSSRSQPARMTGGPGRPVPRVSGTRRVTA